MTIIRGRPGRSLTREAKGDSVRSRMGSFLSASQFTICQLLHSLHVGGAEVLAARLARQLGKQFRFVFACLDEKGSLGEELQKQGFTVQVLERRPGWDWRCSFRLARFLRRERVNLLHAHQYTPFFYAATARLLRQRWPVLFTEHGRHHPDYPRRKRMWANWLLLRQRDRVVAVGEAVRQALVQNEGFPGERVRVIYNGIDLSPYRNGLANRLAVRAELGIGPEELLIFQVARLDYLKDHATAVRTIQRVAQRCPRIRLALIGEGPEMDKIRELVAQHRVQNHICFLGRREDVARLLQAGDLFLLTSISEGIPLTLIEAMAAGLPVVSTAVGGVGEVIAEGKTGLLAPSGDDRALAENILRLADGSSLRRDMGRRGRERANLFFSEDHMHEQYSCLYKEMLGG